MARSKQAAAPSFEVALERLAEIAERLEREPLPLDEALALFTEGVALLRAAETVLGGAEARVRELLDDDSFGQLPEP